MVSTPENALVKPEVYETKRIQLTSPMLHIGSEVSKLSPFEYVQTSNRVYLPNRDLLAKALYQKGKLHEYIHRIENQEEITSLLKEAFGENWQNEKLDGQAIFPNTGISRKWTEEKITDLRPMIRNGFGQLYIPGSSIKGAIRTAIAYHLLKHADQYQISQKTRVSEIETRLRETMGELKRNPKFADDSLFMNSLFSEFSLFYQGKLAPGKTSLPNTDFMRAVHVTDSEPILEFNRKNKEGKPVSFNLPVAVEVIVSSRFDSMKAKYKASLYVEMIRNLRTEFTLSINSELLSWFRHKEKMNIPFKNVDDILNICQEFTKDQWEAEKFYWQDIQNNPHAGGKNLEFSSIRNFYTQDCSFSLKLGWGSGMLGTTVSLCLDEELVETIRDTCGISAPGYEAPKSRRTVVDPKGEIKFVPGWVKFKEL
ncbi:MAG: type III-A CRISPR-associated RAMP protein Csm5 [Phormidium sp.]